ncbi:MAG: twin-arginine translocation signal domain-containing protein [Blastocatellia bacterium]
MTVSRRNFVKTGAMMGISAVTMLKGVGRVFGQQQNAEQEGLFKVPVESQADYRLTEETFSQYINTKFRIQISPLNAVNLKLIKVRRRQPPSHVKTAETVKLDCYSVVFRGPRGLVLESKTYQVEHDQIGAFELFIAPVNDHKNERRYEAVFNRLEQ